MEDNAAPKSAHDTGWATLQYCEDDAAKWASEFRKTAIKLGYSDMDEGWLIAWFANAIEHSCDVRRWEDEKRRAEAEEMIE